MPPGSEGYTRFEPRDFAAGGNHVYCRFTFKNGKVIEWFGTEDTAKTSAAYNV